MEVRIASAIQKVLTAHDRDPAVPPIENVRIRAIHLSPPRSKVLARRLAEHMVVIRHVEDSVDDEATISDRLPDWVEEFGQFGIAKKERARASCHATGTDIEPVRTQAQSASSPPLVPVVRIRSQVKMKIEEPAVGGSLIHVRVRRGVAPCTSDGAEQFVNDVNWRETGDLA